MEEANPLKKKIIKWGIIFLGVVLVFTVLSKTIYTFLLPQVTVEKIGSGRIETKILSEGNIGYDKLTIEAKKVKVLAPIEGEVTKCYVEENQMVKAGDPLIEIKGVVDEAASKQQQQQAAEVAINERTYSREKEEYEEKQKSLREKLARKKAELQSPEKSYEMISLESQIEDKAKEAASNEELLKVGAITRSAYTKSKEDLELLKKQKEALQNKERKNLEENIEDLENKINEIESQIMSIADKIKLEQNRLSAQKNLDQNVTITSPIDGMVYEINVAVGASALNHDQLLVVVPIHIPITLCFEVNDKNADKIKTQQEVRWTHNGQQETAIVMKKKFDEKTGNTIITCDVDKALVEPLVTDYKTYKRVNVECTDITDAYDLLVSNSAIVKEGTNSYIYTVEEVETTFEKKYFVHKNMVTVVKEGDYTSAVSGALAEQQCIVKSTTKPLSEGAEVSKG